VRPRPRVLSVQKRFFSQCVMQMGLKVRSSEVVGEFVRSRMSSG
jgi:hypothetical protein